MAAVVGRIRRIAAMIVLTLLFFLLELVVGQLTGSVALVADSFHMLSDVVALVVSLYAIRLGKRSGPTRRNTYGWQRAEQLGALINGVFLIALVFTIIIEAVQRFIDPVDIENPQLVLIVGGIGLAFNLFGLAVFGHGHSHSHGEGGEGAAGTEMAATGEGADAAPASSHVHSHGANEMAGANMRSLFLHVLGDALGSVGVVVSALVIWLTSVSWRFYVDPLISILLSIIILVPSIPLVMRTSLLLLQGIPEAVDIEKLSKELYGVEGVVNVHELHVWQLRDDKIVASVHLTFRRPGDYLAQAQRIKALFHQQHIHSTTVQPEFLSERGEDDVAAPSMLAKLMPFSREGAGYARVSDGADAASAAAASPSDEGPATAPTANCNMACVENCAEPQCCDTPDDPDGGLRSRSWRLRPDGELV